jgi:hypothetical protein
MKFAKNACVRDLQPGDAYVSVFGDGLCLVITMKYHKHIGYTLIVLQTQKLIERTFPIGDTMIHRFAVDES